MLKFVTLSLTKKKEQNYSHPFWKCQLYVSFGFTCLLCILLFLFRSMKWFLGQKRKLKREDQLQKELKEVALQSNWSKQLVRIWHEYSHFFFFEWLEKILLKSFLCAIKSLLLYHIKIWNIYISEISWRSTVWSFLLQGRA